MTLYLVHGKSAKLAGIMSLCSIIGILEKHTFIWIFYIIQKIRTNKIYALLSLIDVLASLIFVIRKHQRLRTLCVLAYDRDLHVVHH